MKIGKRRPILRDDDRSDAGNDSRPVIVPQSDRALVPTSDDRVRRLRKHLIETLRALRRIDATAPSATQALPELDGFAARVVSVACALCKGWCCKGGGEHAYLDGPTMARVQRENSGLAASSMLKLYMARIPTIGYQGSCIFHGPQGCTLARSLRSDICNEYFCNGLGTYVTSDDVTSSVVVISGEGDKMRTSSVLSP